MSPAAESGAVNKMWVRQQIRLALENLGDHKQDPVTGIFDDHLNKILHNAEELDLDQEHVNWLASQYTRDAHPIPAAPVIVSDTTSTVDTGTVITHSTHSDSSTIAMSEVAVSTSRRKSLRAILEGQENSPSCSAALAPLSVRRKSISRYALNKSTHDKESPSRERSESLRGISFEHSSADPPALDIANTTKSVLADAFSSPPGKQSSGSPPGSPDHTAPPPVADLQNSLLAFDRDAEVSDAIGAPPQPSELSSPPYRNPRRCSLITKEENFDPTLLEPVEIKGEPLLLNSEISPNMGYFYKDACGKAIGPFDVEQILLWDLTGALHSQIPIYHGTKAGALQALSTAKHIGRLTDKTGLSPGLRFYPLSMFRRTMCYVLDTKVADWPIDLEQTKDDVEHTPYSIYSHCLNHRFLVTGQEDLQCTSWKFNIWNYAPFELGPLTFLLMSKAKMDCGFNLSASRWRPFIDRVQHLMERHSNPYHNFYHVVDVMQTTFMFIEKMGARAYMKDIDVLALLVGALVHDLDHPGLNNPYQINCRSRLAILYNDQSVLENYHIATAFEMFELPDFNIFDSIDMQSRKSLRKLMISCVLATDMTVHFQLKSELDTIIGNYFTPSVASTPGNETPVSEASKSSADMTNILTDKDKETLLKSLLHLADIGNPTKPWDISRQWSDLVVQEFFAQGDREKEEGLPVSANMDRHTTMQDELSINFNDFIVAPYFMSMTSVLPSLHTVDIIMHENRNKWHDMFEERMSVSDLEPMAREEALAKWRKRKVAFSGQLKAVVDAAIEKLNN